MRNAFLVVICLTFALIGAWFFELVLSLLTQYNWIGSSYNAEQLRDVRQLYVFAYTILFATALVLRWPVSFKRYAATLALALLGGLLPFIAVLTRWYAKAHFSASEVFDGTEQQALISLLLAHATLLLVIGGLFLLVKKERQPQQHVTTV